jgi:ABC-2 type transport system ATP-binding protein
VAIIETIGLTKSYGSHRGIVDVNLAVDPGEIFGFLGPNGAGKTTTIRLLLDLVRPTSGRATIFGLDSVVQAVAIHRRVGYLPGEFALFDRLTGAQTIDYFANLRGRVDRVWQADLIERLELDPSRRYSEYSRGNKQKVGLVIALQHRPEVLLLDEPTAGLDPLVQQTFFVLLRDLVGEGCTAFLSSHILSEVEKACDRVAIIRDGRIDRIDRVEALRGGAVRAVEIRFQDDVPATAFASIAGVFSVDQIEGGLRLRANGPLAPVIAAAAAHGATDFITREPTLEDVFVARFARDAGNGP